MYNIALVEDEKDLNDLIKTYLEKEGPVIIMVILLLKIVIRIIIYGYSILC